MMLGRVDLGGPCPREAARPEMQWLPGPRGSVYPVIALIMLAVMVLSGCGGPVVDGPTSASPRGTTDYRWEPVKVAGLEGCGVLERLTVHGSTSPDDGLESLRLPCLTRGPAVDLAQLRGRPVLINLWASWCGPCRKEMPLLTAAHEKLGGQVQFVGVDTADTPAPAANFLDEFDVTYPQLADPNSVLLGRLRIPGIPVTLVLGPDGGVLERHIGPFEDDDLIQLLESVIAENS